VRNAVQELDRRQAEADAATQRSLQDRQRRRDEWARELNAKLERNLAAQEKQKQEREDDLELRAQLRDAREGLLQARRDARQQALRQQQEEADAAREQARQRAAAARADRKSRTITQLQEEDARTERYVADLMEARFEHRLAAEYSRQHRTTVKQRADDTHAARMDALQASLADAQRRSDERAVEDLRRRIAEAEEALAVSESKRRVVDMNANQNAFARLCDAADATHRGEAVAAVTQRRQRNAHEAHEHRTRARVEFEREREESERLALTRARSTSAALHAALHPSPFLKQKKVPI
jgi:hypothetical protein